MASKERWRFSERWVGQTLIKSCVLLALWFVLELYGGSSAEARRRGKKWTQKGFQNFLEKTEMIADEMGRPRIGMYMRLAMPIGSYSYGFSSEKNKLAISSQYGFAVFAQAGFHLWPSIGVHATYGYSMMLDRSGSTITLNGNAMKGNAELTGHAFGGGVMIRPFYKAFLVERFKRYRSITGGFPPPSGLRRFLNGLYISGDGFLVKNSLEFTGERIVNSGLFTMGWGWGGAVAVGYESSNAHPATFDIGLLVMYTQNPSESLTDSQKKTTELPGAWGNLFIGVRLTMAIYFPERSMIRGLF